MPNKILVRTKAATIVSRWEPPKCCLARQLTRFWNTSTSSSW